MSNINYRDYTLPLLANVPQDIAVKGDYWQVVKATAEIKLEFDQGVRITRAQGTGGPARYTRVRITSTVDQSVTVALGQVAGLAPYDGRAVFGGAISVIDSLPTVWTPYTDANVASGAQALLLAQNTTRRHLIIRSPSTAAGNVRIGDSTVAAGKGALLEPGDSITIDGSAAIYAWNEAASAVALSLLAGFAP